ncbi:hypothetical protein BJX64DRAFT_262356, partial [Aspergillus heterothallicus]
MQQTCSEQGLPLIGLPLVSIWISKDIVYMPFLGIRLRKHHLEKRKARTAGTM